MTPDMYNELINVILMANKTNSIAIAMGVEVDEQFLSKENGK